MCKLLGGKTSGAGNDPVAREASYNPLEALVRPADGDIQLKFGAKISTAS